MKKFTKGKWDVVTINMADLKQVCVASDAVEQVLCHLWLPKRKITEQTEADAILMSKAPELYDAVVALQPYLERLINLTPSSELRNIMTDENIRVLTLLNEIK